MLDCLIKADAWAQSLGSWWVKTGPTLPCVCGGHWCCSPNSPALPTQGVWLVVIPGSLIFGWLVLDICCYSKWRMPLPWLECLSSFRDVFFFCHSYWQHSPSSAWVPETPGQPCIDRQCGLEINCCYFNKWDTAYVSAVYPPPSQLMQWSRSGTCTLGDQSRCNLEGTCFLCFNFILKSV